MKLRGCLAVLLLSFCPFLQAGMINIDGDIFDWRLHNNGNVYDWLPMAGVYYTIEDQHSNYLEPGWGGQSYDAEALYAYLDDTYLYIAMATDHNPETGNTGGHYGSGDFALDFDKNGSYDAGINIKPTWDGLA